LRLLLHLSAVIIVKIRLPYTKMEMENAFRSGRLVYRACEESDEIKDFISDKFSLDPVNQVESSCISIPGKKKHAEGFLKYVANDTLLGFLICLPEEPAQQGDTKKGHTPIGILNLSPINGKRYQDRHNEIGINIAKDYQGKGYGSEAINWALDWAFTFGGLHRVAIECFFL
jgi:hypothetical protein